MSLKLKSKALFIADAHYPNHKKEEFLKLLSSINSQEIQTPQLILMGDIFDLLVGNSPYLQKRFANEIALINQIAQKIEVIYLEGNHDFYLNPLFSRDVQIIPIEKQPLTLTHNNKSYALSHGDRYTMNRGYKLYTKLIRLPIILRLLPDAIAVNKLKSMQEKKICKEIQNFKQLVAKIAQNYSSDYIIEGHYHQAQKINNYFALPSFACNTQVAIFNGDTLDYTTPFSAHQASLRRALWAQNLKSLLYR